MPFTYRRTGLLIALGKIICVLIGLALRIRELQPALGRRYGMVRTWDDNTVMID